MPGVRRRSIGEGWIPDAGPPSSGPHQLPRMNSGSREHRHVEQLSWIGGPRPRDEPDRLIWEALEERGLRTEQAVASYVAERLFTAHCRGSGFTLGAMWFRSAYVPAGRRIVAESVGRLVARKEAPTCSH